MSWAFKSRWLHCEKDLQSESFLPSPSTNSVRGTYQNLLLRVSAILRKTCRIVTQSLFQVTSSCCWQLLNRYMLWCVELLRQFEFSVSMDIKLQQCVMCLVKERLEVSPAAEGQLFFCLALALQLFDISVSITFQHRSNAYIFRQHVNKTSLGKKLWHQKQLKFVDHYLIIWQNWYVELVEELLLPHLSYQESPSWQWQT